MHNQPFNRAAHWALAALLVVSFLAGALPRPALAATDPTDSTCAKTYTVQGNDGIYRIAKMFGTSAYKIAKANELTLPVTLTPGQKLCIPGENPTNKKIVFTPSISAGKLVLEGSGFPKLRTYFVKVASGTTGPFTKIKPVVTTNKGIMDMVQALPKNLKTGTITVCLKDTVDDYLLCKPVYLR